MAAEARREDGLASGAFNGSGARGLRIDAAGKDKGKEVGDNDQRGEKARRKEEGYMEAVLAHNSGEKDRVQPSCRSRHDGRDHGHHHPHGQAAQARQHAHEPVEDPIGHSKASTSSSGPEVKSGKGSGFRPSSQQSSRMEISKPAASAPGSSSSLR